MRKWDTLPFEFGGHTLEALPQRGLFWPEENALLLADTHLGKDDVFRREGVPVPAGTDADTLARIGELLDRTGASKFWILGDFLHGRVEDDDALVGLFKEWREKRRDVSLVVTVGNHDRHQTDRALLEGVEWVRELSVGGLTLRHDPDGAGREFVIGGHLHPVFRLQEGRANLGRVPVFWIRERSMVLPAFSEFTGGLRVKPAKGDRVIAALESGAVWLRGANWLRVSV